jgi:hypothetical protein
MFVSLIVLKDWEKSAKRTVAKERKIGTRDDRDRNVELCARKAVEFPHFRKRRFYRIQCSIKPRKILLHPISKRLWAWEERRKKHDEDDHQRGGHNEWITVDTYTRP